MTRESPRGEERLDAASPVDDARLFGRAVHTLRMYPRGNELADLALDQAARAVLGSLPIAIGVKARQLVWNETPLEPDVDRAGLAPDLYRDGIRQLELRRGLDRSELEKLILCLARKIDPDDLSEDYVTRLWEAELAHVGVLAIDPYLDHDLPDDVLEGKQRPELERDEAGEGEADRLPPPPDEAFRVSPGDALRVAREIAQNQQSPPWTRFIEVLVATLMSPPGLQRSDDVVRIVEVTFQRLLEAGRLDDAGRLVRRLRDAIPPAALPTLLAAVARMASAERLEPLLPMLEAPGADPAPACSLLSMLQPAATDAVLSLVTRVEGEPTVRALTELLAADPEATRPKAVAAFRSAEPEAKGRLAFLLGRLGGEGIATELAGALADADAAVRAELVRALGRLRDEAATRALLDVALGDAEARCRVMALRGLGRRAIPGAQERLLARLSQVPPASEERSLLFLALGRVAGEEAIPFLTRTLKPGWIPGRWNAEDAGHAAAALAALGTPRAVGVLENLSRSRRRQVADVCNRALFEASREERP